MAAFEAWAQRPWHQLSLLRWPTDEQPTDDYATTMLQDLQTRAAAERRRQELGCWLSLLLVLTAIVAAVLVVKAALRLMW